MKGAWIVATALAGCQTLVANAAAAEKFRKLSAAEIRAKVTGMEVTDEVHSADVFAPGGALISYAMGRKSAGKWRVERDQLCFEKSREAGATTCGWPVTKSN
jgi:S-adenosylmethionine hydrolase